MKSRSSRLVPLAPLLLTLPLMAQQFHSPVGYCKAVGTIDKPDARYVGPKLPGWMARDLNLRSDQSQMMEWRCANGKVLACVYGANIPCDSKANTDRTPSQPVREYCRQNPSSTFVPMVVTGHNTSVSWACTNGEPNIVGSSSVDKQGYATEFWKVVSP
ncbi:hypothetical protein [Acidisarcina polymorpha]|uniref:hypothetical protein n=1 Tax=Acidisarcina polymorpha TaxID=2211140 RepID=UPI001237C5C4|nr:hypothetical protein [Acidisarcina polymorpha]